MTRHVACAIIAVTTLANAQIPTAVSLRIVAPTNETYLSGPVLLRALVSPASQAQLVTNVTFFADGKLVCRVTVSPFECPWDAGRGVRAHQIRATAVLSNGQRLVDTIRTKEFGYVEAVDVPVVQVTAVVTDSEGRFVDGLTRDVFRIFEEDVAEPITYFAAEDAPLDVVVAADVSGSMTEAMPGLKTGVKSFLTALKPETNLTLIGFNDNVFVLSQRGPNPATRIKAVDRLAPWGGTALYNAIVRSIELLARSNGRKALVVFTDGDDQSQLTSREAADGRVEASDAVIFTIAQGRGTQEERFRGVLRGIAQVSGGRAFFADRADELDTAFREIGTELSHQYLLGYAPSRQSRDGAWRRIRVEVNDKTLRVRARRGYRAGGPPASSHD